MSNPKIIIIGAGAAGVACATKLLSYGFKNVTILEAQSRIGGRIYTIPYADNVIDLGAQWCHGQKNNVVYDLVKDLNLLESSDEMQDNYMLARSNGEVLSRKLTKRLLNIYDMLRESRESCEISEQDNASKFYKHQYEQLLNLPEHKDIDRKIAAEFLQNFEKFECSSEGTDSLTELSAAGDDDYEDCEGDQLLNWKDKGYKTILKILMQSRNINKEYGILQERIRLSTEIEQIKWSNNDDKILLSSKNGEEFAADHVIVTVSLGVLKTEHVRLFEPTLPLEKIAAIEAIHFGTVNKIFIEFNDIFWPEKWAGFALLWLEEDLNQIRGTKRAWLEDIVGFFGVNYQPRVLVGWISGASARHVETLETSEVLDGCLEVFKRFLPWHIPTPTSFKVTAWSTNAHFRGSYSYHSIETEEKVITSQKLACPLMIGDRLKAQFAGEATSTQHYSTVHGAIETGWREAARLADFYGMKKIELCKNECTF